MIPFASRVGLFSHLVLLRRHVEQAIEDRILFLSASVLPLALATRGPGVRDGEPAASTVDGVAWVIGDCCKEGDGGICGAFRIWRSPPFALCG